MLKKIFLGLALSGVSFAAYAGDCSSCKESCGCESKKECTCEKDKCDCAKCSEKKAEEKKTEEKKK
jgi:hypothetical protein